MEIRRDMLEKIAAHTEKRAVAEFYMGDFCTDTDGNDMQQECGSLMCIIGDCPAIGEEFQMIAREMDEDECWLPSWGEYSVRITGVDYFSPDWDYLFSGQWAGVDNTPKGAAARIRYYLEHGLPSDWEDQMRGNAPLSYA